MAQRLQGEALVVHLFVAAGGPDREADHAYLRAVWQRCADRWGMTAAIPDVPPDLADGVDLLAARRYPGATGPVGDRRTGHRHADTLLDVAELRDVGRWE